MRPVAVPLPKDVVADLRAQLGGEGARVAEALAFDVEPLDVRLANGGLVPGLHEISPASSGLADDAAASLFAAGIAARAAGQEGAAFWVVTRFDLYAPGLEQAGLAPARVLFAEVRDEIQVLAAMEDALRDGSVQAVVGEVCRASMTATRRLQLAATEGGCVALLFRRWRRSGVDPLSEPSAATTRWRLGVAPSARKSIPGVGHARWTVECARQRNGAPFTLEMEGCDATGRLAVPRPARDRAAAATRTAARAA